MEVITEDWKKLMGNLPIEDIPPVIIQLSGELYSEDDWGLDSENEQVNCLYYPLNKLFPLS
jgi:hypothetical protein